MKHIFISYAHKGDTKFADDLFKRMSDYRENGNLVFDVHKDNEGAIRDSRHWDSELEEALNKSEYVIYLMDEHSTSSQSVCRDEIAYALNKSKKIIPVRIANVQAPLIVARLQWIDWLNRENGLDSTFKKILDFIDDYSKIYADGCQGKIYENLYVADYICEPGEVVGREDVFEEVSEFIKGNLIGPFVIKGIAGSGKSAIAKKLAENLDEVHSIHQCKFNDVKTKSAANVLRNLAYYLACVDDDYKKSVEVEELEKVGDWSVEEIFRKLFANHLNNEREKYALVIDGVDEMGTDEAEELISVLCDNAGNVSNVKFIFTIRTERQYESMIVDLPFIELTKEINIKASEESLRKELEARGLFTENLLKKILEASEGNFLYIKKLFEDYDKNRHEISENVDFPKGLSRLYQQFMKRLFDKENNFDDYYPVISVLCAVSRPVTFNELLTLTGTSKRSLSKILINLQYLIKEENGRISFFHRSILDFLTDDSRSRDFFVDSDDGDKTIVVVIKNLTLTEIKNNSYLKNYAFRHIYRQKDVALADKLYEEDAVAKEWVSRCSAKSVEDFDKEEFSLFAKTVDKAESGYNLVDKTFGILNKDRKLQCELSLAESIKNSERLGVSSLLGKGMPLFYLDKMAEAKETFNEAFKQTKIKKDLTYETKRNLVLCLDWLGFIAYKEDNIQKAKDYYAEALEKARENAKDYPSYESNRELSISLNKMGDVERRHNNINDIIGYYEQALEIRKENAEKYPSYESKRDLAISLNKMSYIAKKEGDAKKAKEYYEKALEIAKENATKYPSYESNRDLAISLNNMGDIAKKDKEMKIAKDHYGKSFELARENAQKYPSYSSSRDLSYAFTKMGDIAKKDKELKKAKDYYEKALEIAKGNALKYQSYDSKRDLSYIFSKMGDITLKEHNTKNAKEFFEESLKIARENAKKYPSYENNQALLVSCCNLVYVEMRGGNYSKAKVLCKEALALAEKDLNDYPNEKSQKKYKWALTLSKKLNEY